MSSKTDLSNVKQTRSLRPQERLGILVGRVQGLQTVMWFWEALFVVRKLCRMSGILIEYFSAILATKTDP